MSVKYEFKYMILKPCFENLLPDDLLLNFSLMLLNNFPGTVR